MAKAMVKGDPERMGVMEKSLRGKLVEFTEHLEVVVTAAAPVERLEVAAYTIPTDAPESDGTLEWDSTTIVVVEAHAGGRDRPRLHLRRRGRRRGRLRASSPASSRPRTRWTSAAAWLRDGAQVRNAGRPGIAAMAISAVDAALWDLKARLLDVPLVALLGAAREDVPVYGSGGFTLVLATSGSASSSAAGSRPGIPRVKMKIGREPERDPGRVGAAREAIGADAELFVDANGAYARKQALALAERVRRAGRDLVRGAGLLRRPRRACALLRDRGPAGHGDRRRRVRLRPGRLPRMLEAGPSTSSRPTPRAAAGSPGFSPRRGARARRSSSPLSAHCAPAICTRTPCCAVADVRHLEYFHDHVRIEHMLFDGVPEPEGGVPAARPLAARARARVQATRTPSGSACSSRR